MGAILSKHGGRQSKTGPQMIQTKTGSKNDLHVESKKKASLGGSMADVSKSVLSSPTKPTQVPENDGDKFKLGISPGADPIPPIEELNRQFELLMAELALPPAKADVMRAFPPDRKWMLLLQQKTKAEVHKVSNTDIAGKPKDPSQYIELLNGPLDPKQMAKHMQALEISLRSEPLSWVSEFINALGLPCVLEIVKRLSTQKILSVDERESQHNAIRALKALLNNSVGLSAMIDDSDGINILAISFDCANSRMKAVVLEMLAAVCFVNPPKGHNMVVNAMTYYKEMKGEPARFQTMLGVMDPEADLSLLVACLTFINALIQSPEELEFRCTLRSEFQDLGIEEILQQIANVKSEELQVQINLYEEEGQHDYEAICEAHQIASLDMNNPEEMFAAINTKMTEPETRMWFTRVLRHCLLIPVNKRCPKYWQLIDILVNEILLKRYPLLTKSINIDVAKLFDGLVMNDEYQHIKLTNQDLERQVTGVSSVVKQMEHSVVVKEAEIAKLKAARDKDREKEKEAKEARDAQEKKWAEEKRDLLAQLKRAKLAAQSTHSSDPSLAVQTPSRSSAESIHISQPLSAPPVSENEPDTPTPETLPSAPSPDANGDMSEPGVSVTSSNVPPPPPPPPSFGLYIREEVRGPAPPPPMSFQGGPPPPPMPEAAGGPPPPPPPPGMGGPPPPPPPPGMGGPPPPPPPPGMGGPPPPPPPGGPGAPPPPSATGVPFIPSGAFLPPKPKIVPNTKMKQLNWTKLPPIAIPNTLWKQFQPEREIKLRKEKLDIAELEELFTAVFSPVKSDAPATSNPNPATSPNKSKAVALLDSKRSYNVSIMISRIKLGFPALRTAILTLEDEKLPEQMLKQFLNNIPTTEEIDQLADYVGHELGPERDAKVAELGKAEQFFCEMMLISNYETRLNSIYFKRRLGERIEDVKPSILIAKTACEDLRTSVKFAKVLEVILAIGNYMNGGSFRGGAFGFSIDTLTKLGDTKVAGNSKKTLLHYIVDTLDKKFPETAGFEKEIASVDKASKVSLITITQEMNELQKGFADIEKSLPNFDQNSEEDRFYVVFKAFIDVNKALFEDLNNTRCTLEKTFNDTCSYFGEDPKMHSPETFFGLFAAFLAAVEQARKDNERESLLMKKAAERAAKEEAKKPSLKNKGLPGRNLSGRLSSDSLGMEERRNVMDDLISSLKTGDAFKANRKRDPSARRAEVLSMSGDQEILDAKSMLDKVRAMN